MANGFWQNFASGLENSPGGSLLGVGLNAFLNRHRNQVPRSPAGMPSVPPQAMGTPPIVPSQAPSPVTGMGQPTLFAPGAKSQIDVSAMPQGPGFKFPSAMRTGMYPDGNGGYTL